MRFPSLHSSLWELKLMKIAHTWHAVLLYPKTSGVQYFYAHHTVRFLSSSRHMRAVAHPLTHPSSNMNTTHHPNNMVPCYTSDKSSLSTLAQGFYILSGQYQNMSAVQELHVCVCVCVCVCACCRSLKHSLKFLLWDIKVCLLLQVLSCSQS